jgi:pimeloyl-ACP methyl ester carboxylesterase
LDSCYEDFSSAFYENYGNWTAWSLAPFRETVRLLFPLVSGVKVNNITLADPINALNGKDVFFVQGGNDEIFGAEGAKHLKDLASVDNNAELWLVDDAFHLRIRSRDSELYLQKIVKFLSSSYNENHTA